MNLELNNKVIIVTGGAKGIGKAIVLELVKEGAIPVIAGRSMDESEQLMNSILSSGGKCYNIIKDLNDGGACQQIVEEVVQEFGHIDGIVNNAGVNDGVGLENGSPEDFKVSLNNNLLHYYDLVHFALPYLKESKGAIINISSKTALTGQGGTSGYAASKGAQLALTREWAAELLPYGIRVNAIIPAEVMTPLYQKWLSTFDNSDEKLKGIIEKIPLDKRMTKAEEIASMTVFLLSKKSGHTTGQWVIVDGGYVHLDRALT